MHEDSRDTLRVGRPAPDRRFNSEETLPGIMTPPPRENALLHASELIPPTPVRKSEGHEAKKHRNFSPPPMYVGQACSTTQLDVDVDDGTSSTGLAC